MKKNQTGFTLIELILYIALVSIFITGAIFFAWDVIYGREKAFQQQIVEQNSRAILARIAYEIRRASDINSVTSSSIQLENGVNDTTISLSSGTVQTTTGGAGPFSLSSNQVVVTDLSFTNLTSANNNTNNIDISITVRQAQAVVSGQFEAQTTMNQSVELNTAFNSGRALLIDATNLTLAGGDKKIENITLDNTGSSSLTIDKITPTWTGGAQIEKIKIEGTDYWKHNGAGTPNGKQDSGTELDIDNYPVATSGGPFTIDEIKFSSAMDAKNLTLLFTLLDGSTRTMALTNLGSGGGGGGTCSQEADCLSFTYNQLAGGDKKMEFTLQNTGSVDIRLDKVTLTWTGGETPRQTKKIKIDNNIVYDNGEVNSGTQITLDSPFTLSAGTSYSSNTNFEFKKKINGSTFTSIVFEMQDGTTLTVPSFSP